MDALLGKGTAKSRFAKIRSAVRDHAVEGTASQKKKLWDVSPGAAAGSQVILIVNHGDDGGLSTPHSAALPPNVVVETVTDIAAEAFGFARACDVFADEARATSVTDEDAWQAHLKQRRSGAAARRTAKVIELARRAATLADGRGSKAGAASEGARARQRIAGFEQLYELLDQRANLGGVVATPDAVQAVLRGLAAHDYADEVASAAAAAGWKMADRSKELCSQLLRGRAPALCVALLQQEALRREDLKKRRPNALRTAAKREAFVESLYSSEVQRQKTLENVAKEPSTKGRRASAFDVESALFCTKHALGGCRHVVGLLGALAARDDAAKRVVAESGTPWLLAASAGYGATERVATAAAVLNVALASSSKARECLLKRDASFEDLLALLDSSTTRLNMLGAGAVATLLRERRHRRRVPAGLAAVAFAKLAKLAAWCAEQAREPSERGSSDSEADDDSKSLDSVVNPGARGTVVTPKTHRATELRKAGEARAVAAAATKAPPADAALKPRRGGQMQLWEHAAEKAEERSFDAHAVIPLLQQVLFGLWAVTALLRERGADALAALYAPPVATWVVADGERPRQRRRSSAAGRVDDARGAIDATWPETLLLVATFDHLDASFPAECAAAALAVATSWPGAGPALDAATVPPRAAVDKLCACVETSYSLEVRTACALALAHVTSAPSQSLATFQSPALDGDKRLVAVLGLEIGSAALDDAISAALFNVALHAAVGSPRSSDVLAAHVALVANRTKVLDESVEVRANRPEGFEREREETVVVSKPSPLARQGVRKLRPVDTDEDFEKRREEEAAAATRSHGLRRDCLGIWALARGDHDRKVLNYLGAPATLAQVLNSDVPLYTKEAAAAALWQLAGDAVGAATMGVSINNDVKSRTGGAATKEIARLSAAAAKLEAEVLSLETRVTNPAFQRNVSEAIFDEATRALRAKQEEATRVAQTLSDLNAKIDRNVESIAAVRADYEEQKSPVPALVRLVVDRADRRRHAPARALACGALCLVARANGILCDQVAAYGEPLVACLLAAAHEPNPESGAADLPGAEDVYETMRRGFPADCVDDGIPDDKVRRASRGELALQICAVDLLFLLHDTDEGRAAIAASPDGDAALELLCCELLAHPRHYILRGVGAFRAAKLSATSTHRRLHLDDANAVLLLTATIRNHESPPSLRIHALHALLNLSTEPELQEKICHLALLPLLDCAHKADDLDDGPDAAMFPARDDDDSTQNMSFVEDFLSQWNEEDKVKQRDVEARFAQSILANLSKTAEVRSMMFALQLSRGSLALHKVKKRSLEPSAAPPDLGDGTTASITDAESLRNFMRNPAMARAAKKSAERPRTSDGPARRTVKSEPFGSARPDARILRKLQRSFQQPVSRLWDAPPIDHQVVHGVDLSPPKSKQLYPGGTPNFGAPFGSVASSSRPGTAPAESLRRSPGISPPERAAVLPAHDRRRRPSKSSIMRGDDDDDHGRRSIASDLSSLTAHVRPSSPVAEALALRPRSPLRSSNRAGPLSGDGTWRDMQGDDRWGPTVLRFRKDGDFGHVDRSAAMVSSPRVVHLDRCRVRFHAPPPKLQVPPAQVGVTDVAPQKLYSNVKKAEELNRKAEGAIAGMTAAKLTEEGYYTHDDDLGDDDATAKLEEFNKKAGRGPGARGPRLCKFDRTPGARVYSGLFQEYTFAHAPAETTADVLTLGDGGESYEHCYLYYQSHVVAEASDPGVAVPPRAPGALGELWQASPPTQPPAVPDGDSNPRSHNPLMDALPEMKRHALVLCASSGVYGGIPAEPMTVHVKQRAKAPEPEPEPEAAPEPEPEKPAWRLETSMFAPRLKEADSRQFLDAESVLAKALACDWRMVLAEDRFHKFVRKMDEGVKGGESIDDELEDIRKAFAGRYATVLRLFDYYCACSSILTKAAFSISQNSYNLMLQETGIPDETTACTFDECKKVFIVCNFEADKKSEQSDMNEDKALMRYEFIECLVRMAHARFKKDIDDVSECVDALFDDVVLRNVTPESILDTDDFRRDRLYFEEVEDGFRPHLKPLRIVYDKYAMLKPDGGRPSFSLMEWVTVLNDGRLIGDELTVREARLCFFWSRMVVADEVKSRHKFMTLSWVEFLEALARVADMTNVPTDEMVADCGAINMIDYEFKVQKMLPEEREKFSERRPSADLLAPKTRPLGNKVDKLCKSLLGYISCAHNGVIQHGGKRARLIGTYITEAQFKEIM